MLSWTQTAMVTCSAPKQNHYVTLQKQWMPLQRAQLQRQGKRKMTRYGQREKETATTYFYLQSDGSTWISTPSSSSTLGLDHYGYPGSSLGWLAGWLVANSGLCVRRYPTQMSPIQFQYPVPQPAWVPWWAVYESAWRQTCTTSD